MEINAETKEQLITLYKVTIDDIRDSKHQQWRILQLTLLAIAAIASLHNYSPESFRPIVLVWIIYIIGFLGIVFIWLFAYSLSKYRKRKDAIAGYFTDIAKEMAYTKLWNSWRDKVIKKLQATPVFAALFTLFIGIAAWIARSIILS